jgi:hypothetical protein
MANVAGDPSKAAERIVDIVTLTGTAEGKKALPERVPLGKLGVELIKSKLETALAELESWRAVSESTDFVN